MEPVVDIFFPVISRDPLPADHGYILYAAISRMLPEVHNENGIAVHPIAGRLIGNRMMQPIETSHLAIRLTANQIPLVIQLAGRSLNLADQTLRVGIPSVKALVPATALRSRITTTKNGENADHFRSELRRQLALLNVSSDIDLTLPLLPARRTIRIKGKEIVGHEVILTGISAQESLDIQIHGLGGRRHMGCGIFLPLLGKAVGHGA